MTSSSNAYEVEQDTRDLELVLNALEFYRLAAGEGYVLENEEGHRNEPEEAFFDYFNCSELPDEDGNYEAIPKRIYDRLNHRHEQASALREAAASLIPSNLNIDNPNLPDDAVIPLDVTLGELRSLRTALHVGGREQ